MTNFSKMSVMQLINPCMPLRTAALEILPTTLEGSLFAAEDDESFEDNFADSFLFFDNESFLLAGMENPREVLGTLVSELAPLDANIMLLLSI
jgi:hypothetical protein